ncbi:MAG: translation initiation factor IF-2 subunit gamma, partial [Acidilobaceae archaeon]
MSEPRQPDVNIGVVGHVDHGKTTLVQALTGIWTMRFSEEIKKGMTIRLGYADGEIWICDNCDYPANYSPEPVCECKPGVRARLKRRVSFIDAPGHETLMATMLSGATLMDGAILVIAANEPCPQPQTREHLAALTILGIKNIIIVQNKVDAVTPEQAKKNYNEILEFVEGTIAESSPIIPVSALKKANIDVVLAAIDEVVKPPERDLSSYPLMYIVRSFDVNKPGTGPESLVGGVVGGSLVKGVLRVGDEVEIRPGILIEKKDKVEYMPIYTTVTSLRFGDIEVEEAKPGGLVAVGTKLDPVVTKSDRMAGSVLGKPDKLPPVLSQLVIRYELFE